MTMDREKLCALIIAYYIRKKGNNARSVPGGRNRGFRVEKKQVHARPLQKKYCVRNECDASNRTNNCQKGYEIKGGCSDK